MTNRRILLIDADHDFYDRLSELLGRYRLDILVRPDLEDAIADGARGDPPTVILVGVDEPDKAGFKIFQQLKKGPLSKVPIILATKTVTAAAMAKHGTLKTHADAYMDKRSLSDDELLGKLDNLISLGEPDAHGSSGGSSGGDIDIPVEIDDIPVGHDDMVLEETVGEDEGYDQGGQTVAGRSDAVDQMVAAETDAAFDALLGGFGDEPAIAAAPIESDHGRDDRPTTPPPIGDDDHATTIAPPIGDHSPAALADAGARFDSDEGFDTFSQESPRPTLQRVAQEAAPVYESAPHEDRHRYESSPAIQLDADDLIDDADVVEDDSGGVPEPVLHANLVVRRDDDENLGLPITVPEAIPEVVLVEPILMPTAAEVPEPVLHETSLQEPMTHEPSVPEHIPMPAAVTRAPSEPPARARAARPTQNPVFDLGLDAIAADAESEQSGVFDRKSLRQIGELERQIAQLKTELDRARASAESPRGGSNQREFFNLKEQVIAKDSDLRRLTNDLEAKSRELTDAEERIRQIQQTRMDLEAKSAELEQRVAADAAKGTALATRERALAAQLASVQQDLDSKIQAFATAETARTQLERDLASERATRAASASDAERALRVEREQMIARHQGELGQLRQDHAGTQAVTLEKQRQELVAGHGTAIEAVKAEHAAALDIVRKQSTTALEAARTEAATETELAAARRDATHAADLQRIEQDHAAALARAVEERDAAATRAKGDHAGALDRLLADHATELAHARDELAAQTATAATTHSSELERAREELDVQAAIANAAHADELARLRAELTTAASAHATELVRVRDELASQTTVVTAGHDRAMADAKAELARVRTELTTQAAAAAAAHGGALADANAELERARDELTAHTATAAAAHDRAVGEISAEVQRLEAALATAHAARGEELAAAARKHAGELIAQANQHASVLAARESDLIGQRQDDAIAHTAALAELEAELDRQAASHGIKLDGAKKDLDDILAAHENAKSKLALDHDRLLGERAAAHSGELADLEANRKAAIDDLGRTKADHRKALEAAAAQHANEITQHKELADREITELKGVLVGAKRAMDEAAARHQAEREANDQAHATAFAEHKAQHERAMALVNGEVIKVKAVGDAELARQLAARDAEHDKQTKAAVADQAKAIKDLTAERDEMQRGLSAARDTIKRSENELATAVQTIADRNAELRSHAAGIGERDQRIADLRKEIESLETENASYQDQVLRAYQKIKSDEVMVSRARKAMAIALTVLDDDPKPKADA